ncbi:MAG: winged helix-turn-helix transcriptional regulator [Rhodospirillales bacterium]|nr:winged helix-turn-helix transcriptional regulator [Rhodospirillales bacterium]
MANSRNNASDTDAETLLGVLNAIENNSRVTQRAVASNLGIAVGLANAYLKRCIKKGLIKVFQAPANRYAYYLTPSGFSEKSRLTAQYLSISFNFYREARTQCLELIRIIDENNWNRVALYGASDLVEIMTLCVADTNVELLGVVDKEIELDRFSGLTVFQNIEEMDPIDAVIVTDIKNPQTTFDEIIKKLPRERVLVPRFFNITHHQPVTKEQ